MIQIIKRYFTDRDERGKFEGLINFGNWREFNIVETNANVTRGNHYHKKTKEIFIILKGVVKVTAQNIVKNKLTGDTEEKILKKGDVILIEPYVNHIFYILEKSKWINILSQIIQKDSPDIHRIKENLI